MTGRFLSALVALVFLVLVPAAWADGRDVLIRGATVVTMNANHTVIPRGRVLVSGDEIEAVWRRSDRPRRLSRRRLHRATTVKARPDAYLFPGLVNLHDHPGFDVLPAWPAPSSHEIPAQGKAGSDPYDNRYEWNTDSPDEYERLVANPADAIVDLNLYGEAVKYAEVQGLLGGETATQGASHDPQFDGVLARNVESDVFNTRIAGPRVGPITDFEPGALAELVSGMKAGAYDAWMVHLAEGVRDADRRPGDTVSSRAELRDLASKQLLNDVAVIIHGLGLERSDFAAMAAAPTIRTDGKGDRRGAKLVWSPRSNLQLYGKTANVYQALAEGVLVSLGTDWTPSGSASLLGELKVANRALRDSRVLGASRSQVPTLSIDGLEGKRRKRAERRLDRTLVDMVTRNPALTLHWDRYVGSIRRGLRADLLLIREPKGKPDRGLPASPYRSLIEASEADVRLVMVDGETLVGGERRMSRLSPGDFEVLESPASGYARAIDATAPGVPEGNETYAQFSGELRAALAALGGDAPPAGGGPAPDTNTYSYLKARWAGGALAGATDPQFRSVLTALFGTDSLGRLNIEAIDLKPVIDTDDDFLSHLLGGDVDPNTGLIADPAPPFALYPANLNHIGPGGNPFADLP